jgi:hypothetical protein
MLVLGTACHVEGKVKAGSDESRSEPSDAPMTVSAPASAAPAPVAAPAPTAPPADACPVTCFEARGSQRADVTAEEQTQLRSALEPVLSQMRSCTSADDWRRHGSPVINLRIAPDGTLSDLGVDPHHGHDGGCFDQAGRNANVSVALPGRKVVRCSERCLRDPALTRARGRRRR